MSTPRDGDLIGPAIRRARRSGLRVTGSFEHDLQDLAEGGMVQARGDTEAVRQAADRLTAESIRIAQVSGDPALESEHLRRAQSSLCPLWPIC
jgi:hypothetical protein